MPDSSPQISVVPYDPQWVARFRQEAAELRAVFGEQAMAIHHIGSTSVPDLSAKPIIDIMLEVRAIEAVDLYNQQMRDLGYDPRGEHGLPRRRYFQKIEHGQHISHVHTWQSGDPELERHVSFRDYLISHPQTRDAYGQLKTELAAQFADDREGYMDGKHAFCQETERRAVAWSRAIRAQKIETERLTLRPLNPAQLWHYLNRPSQLEAAWHLRLSRNVLADPVPRAIRTKLRNSAGAELQQLLWNTYWLVIIREDSFGAGLIGFKGTPEPDGTVEIGYGIDADVRQQGYATESVRALVNWALAQPGCRAVTACTEKDNIASMRVLEKLSFSIVRETDEEFRWTTAATPGGPIPNSVENRV